MFIAIILLLLAPVSLWADGLPPRPQLLVTIRQELPRPLTSGLLHQIASEVKTVWRPYLDLELTSPVASSQVLADDRLELVLTGRTSAGADGLGWIEFVNGEPGRIIHVSMAAVDHLIGQGSWAGRLLTAWPPIVRERFLVRATALGAAHEVGHYLLRSKQHRSSGLMRQSFTVDQIMNRRLNELRLPAEDERALDRRAASYLLARRRLAELTPQ